MGTGMNKMTFKEWLLYRFPVSEIIIGGSTPLTPEAIKVGGDIPVEHPIGFAPQVWNDFNTQLLHRGTNMSKNLCYHNATRKNNPNRANVDRVVNEYTFVTKGGVCNINDFFKSLTQHKFCISPEGNGIDCHRHYETLLAKGIPIVEVPDEQYSHKRWGRNSYVTEKYADLPVLWTEDYTELSVEYLEKQYNEFLEIEFDFSKLTKSYWQQHSSNITECTDYWCNRFNVNDKS